MAKEEVPLPTAVYQCVADCIDRDQATIRERRDSLCREHPDWVDAIHEVFRCFEEPPPPSTLRIGGHPVLRRLGAGAFGEVYLVLRTTEPRLVAAKLLRRPLDKARMRFRREAESLLQLRHPGIAQLFDCDLDGEQPHLFMEYVPGPTLDRYVRSVSPDTAQRIRLMLDVCDAVQHAHDRGWLHRDLKPSNILVTLGEPPQVKLVDFGLAREVLPRPDETVTEPGGVLGTYEYMPPEQVAGDDLTVRADVYSLAVVLFQLLTGHLPIPISRTMPARRILDLISTYEADPASRHTRELRGDIDAILAKALRKDPETRYENVKALADDLRAHLDSRPVQARRHHFWYRAHRFARRHRRAVLATAVTLLCAVFAWSYATEAQARLSAESRATADAAFRDAREAAARGAWQDAIDLGARARDAGHTDPIGISILQATALEAMGSRGDCANLLAPLVAAELPPTVWSRVRVLFGAATVEDDLQAARQLFADALAHKESAQQLSRAEANYAAAMLAGDVMEAIRLLRAGLAANPEHVPSLQTLGPLYLIRGETENALRLADDYELLYRNALEPDVLRCMATLFSGQYATSEQAIVRLATRHQQLAIALRALVQLAKTLDEVFHLAAEDALAFFAARLGEIEGARMTGPAEDEKAKGPEEWLFQVLPRLTRARPAIQQLAQFHAGPQPLLRLRLAPQLWAQYDALQRIDLRNFKQADWSALRDLPEQVAALAAVFDDYRRTRFFDADALAAARNQRGLLSRMPNLSRIVASLALAMPMLAFLEAYRAGEEAAHWRQQVDGAVESLLAWPQLSESSLHSLIVIMLDVGLRGAEERAQRLLSRWQWEHGATAYQRCILGEFYVATGRRAEACAVWTNVVQDPAVARDDDAFIRAQDNLSGTR
ncbi:MAG: protein kinase [Planctomycetes bacterium]|nr:protein kinase [Planctomycetota bacterium]